MSKMREAFEDWNNRFTEPYQGAEKEAAWMGYQAAIAAIREGGAACIGYGFVDGKSGPVLWVDGYPKVGEMLYRLPEDLT